MTNTQGQLGTYVALEVDATTRHLLDEFVTNELKLPNPIDPEYYHTTVIYSRTLVPEAANLPQAYSGTATGLRYKLFTTKEGKTCLTILVESYQARALNTHLTSYGATSDYEHYTPHLTLSYDYTGSTDNLPLPNFPFTYDQLTVKPLDITFIPPSKAQEYITLED